jgi:hypothetical protein
MRMILATLLYHFDWQLCEESQGWVDQKCFTLWEKLPLMCRVADRPCGDGSA